MGKSEGEGADESRRRCRVVWRSATQMEGESHQQRLTPPIRNVKSRRRPTQSRQEHQPAARGTSSLDPVLGQEGANFFTGEGATKQITLNLAAANVLQNIKLRFCLNTLSR